jgi:hypothetical protein
MDSSDFVEDECEEMVTDVTMRDTGLVAEMTGVSEPLAAGMVSEPAMVACGVHIPVGWHAEHVGVAGLDYLDVEVALLPGSHSTLQGDSRILG